MDVCGGGGLGDSESSRRFTDVDQYVSVEGAVCHVYQPVLQTVETVELKPSRSRVQQLRPVNRRRDTIVLVNGGVGTREGAQETRPQLTMRGNHPHPSSVA